MVHRKGFAIIVLVQIRFIQSKQFNETHIYISHTFSQKLGGN